MTTKQSRVKPSTTDAANVEKIESSVKKCFIIMPISDSDGYENGHFKRVYEYIIKPACKATGFTPIRSDDVAASNYIVIDILKNLLDCDLAICDLSARNPNVLYELGIRQAFNKPTVLMKDHKTSRIFDIQGFRDIEYHENLRIDSVNIAVDKLIKSINETSQNTDDDINSIVQLLGVQAASITSNVALSDESSVILSAIQELTSRVTNNLTTKVKRNFTSTSGSKKIHIDGERYDTGDFLTDTANNRLLGSIVDFDTNDEIVLVKDRSDQYHEVAFTELPNYVATPF